MARQYDDGQEELIQKICNLLEMQLGQVIGHIGQSPYQEMFFEIFEEVYRCGYFKQIPSFRADWLGEIIWDRVPHEERQTDTLAQLIDRFGRRWDDWRYAWDRAARDHGFTPS